MHCPKCDFKKTRIIRTRPDPELPSVDLVRQCKNPGCLTVFTSRESVISIIENSQDREIVKALAHRIEALPPPPSACREGATILARADLLKLLKAG